MKRGLFFKYVTLFVGLVTVVLVINAALDLYFVYQDNRRASIDVQREKAEAAAQKVESFVREIEHQIGWVAYPQWAALPVEQRRFEYVRLLRQVPAITELTQLDRTGHEQLKVSRLSMDVVGSDIDRSTEPAFTEAVANKVYFGPVYYRKESEPYLSMAVAHGGRTGGVTVAEINLKLILDVITQIKVGHDGYAYVVDTQGRLLAHPDISLVLRGTDMNRLAQVAEARAAEPAAEHGASRRRDLAGRPVLSAHAEIPALKWLVFVELPSAEVLKPVYDTGIRDLALLVLGLMIAGTAAPCWRAAWWSRSASCRPAPSASAAANSGTAFRSRPATSSKRWPTSSTARPRRSRNPTRRSNRGSRTAPPSCAKRWSSRPRPRRSCTSSRSRRPTSHRC